MRMMEPLIYMYWILGIYENDGTPDIYCKLGICENDGTPDVYPHHPEDLELDWYLQTNFSTILIILKDIKESGNIYYRKVIYPLHFIYYRNPIKVYILYNFSLALKPICCFEIELIFRETTWKRQGSIPSFEIELIFRETTSKRQGSIPSAVSISRCCVTL